MPGAATESRRSMRVWPIKGNNQDELDANFRDFAVETLQIPTIVIRSTSIADVIRVRSSPNNAVYMGVLVTFGEITDRDLFFSKARNLSEYRAPTAVIRLDIPPFLLGTFKMLNNHGYEIRKANGNDTRRYIKYNEESLSLFLEVKLPNQTKWIKIRPEQARTYCEEKDRADYQMIRKNLLQAANDPLNSNMILLGTRSSTAPSLSGPRPSLLLPTTSESQVSTPDKPKWAPPPRASPPKKSSGYALRNPTQR